VEGGDKERLRHSLIKKRYWWDGIALGRGRSMREKKERLLRDLSFNIVGRGKSGDARLVPVEERDHAWASSMRRRGGKGNLSFFKPSRRKGVGKGALVGLGDARGEGGKGGERASSFIELRGGVVSCPG